MEIPTICFYLNLLTYTNHYYSNHTRYIFHQPIVLRTILQGLYEQGVIIYLRLYGWHIGLLVWLVDVTFIRCSEMIDSSHGQDTGHAFGLVSATFPECYVVIGRFHIFDDILL